MCPFKKVSLIVERLQR